jgi:L-alanine-DL-glutamate epimerase-like enolase superfamily enzyme
MRITDVRVVMHERELGFIGTPPLPPTSTMPIGVVRVLTDEGIEGNVFVGGPVPALVQARQIVETLKPVLMGRDPLDIGELWAAMWRRRNVASPMAIGALDVALWDIAGKVAGLPIHRLLGTCRAKIPAYVSSWVHRSHQAYVDEALHYQAAGWTGYKLHPLSQLRMFGVDPSWSGIDDITTCQLIREAVGDDMCLMLDSAWAYDYNEALRVGKAIQEFDYHWYEDPLQADDLYGYRKLREKLDITIVATEVTEGSLWAMPPWITERATDALRGDVMLKGGLTPLMKIAHLAEAFRMNCEVHDGFTSLGNVACLHAVMAMPNTSMFEVITINAPGRYGFDHLNYGLAEPIEFDNVGNVLAPTRPGLGHAIDWDLINSNVTAELT